MKRNVATLPPLAAKLLAAIRHELAELLKVDLYNLPSDRMKAGRIRMTVKDANEGIVRLDLDKWIGHALDDAERRAAHRAVDRLAEAGILVRLVTATGRTTHIRVKADEYLRA
jgi:hypothetical protein